MASHLTRRAALAGIASVAASSAFAAEAYPVGGKVERLDPALDALIDVASPVELVIPGFNWSEGPVWVGGADGYLLVSDPRGNVIRRWNAKDGMTEWLRPSGYPADGPEAASLAEPGTNGLIVARGGIVACDSGTRCLWHIDLKTRKKTMLADRFEGKRFNSPNDLVLAKDGAIYFTDPPYGLKGGGASTVRELDYTGVFRLSPKNEVTLIDRTVSPNGIALTPDGKTLYATDRSGWVAWDLDKAGKPGPKHQFIERTAIVGGDGFKIDSKGFIWASSRDGISICDPTGKRLGIIRGTDPVISNCDIGGDGYLYMSNNHGVLRVKVKAKKLKV